ncbi:hypothetical protein XTALMG727_2944 [Xanthomonas translucens pv. arrhenatheri LMG 727]|uniref:Uncharacterized protein n=1 Tax=Xanthomonas graminis pv. arrhenatheri LMG 727 TaxID=1195923 RepID=A0A0K2ZWC4_9XANT|nr:hypothetical protein XTALMG727_2944 [Xanthomonas translucens pv. arrhenatheri LMG 727]
MFRTGMQSGLQSLPQEASSLRGAGGAPVGATSVATNAAAGLPPSDVVAAQAAPTVHPAGYSQAVVGAASAATSEAVNVPNWHAVGTAVPPTRGLAAPPRRWSPCGSDFSRDERSGGPSGFGRCRGSSRSYSAPSRLFAGCCRSGFSRDRQHGEDTHHEGQDAVRSGSFRPPRCAARSQRADSPGSAFVRRRHPAARPPDRNYAAAALTSSA